VELRPGYKTSEIGVVPEDWEVIDLSNLCTLQRGFDITEATRVPGAIPVFSSSGLSYYHNKAMVSPPGVVTGRKGILGNVFLINEPFWPHDTTLWVKDFRGNHPGFVALMLQNFRLERLDAATSVPTLNRNNLAGHRIAIPTTRVEQEAIAEALSDADAYIESVEQLIVKKRHLKRGAMQELLTGKRRLPGFSHRWELTPLGQAASLYQPQTISQAAFATDGYPVYGANGIIGHYHKCNHETWQITISCRGNCGTVNKTEGKSWITGNAMVVNCDNNSSISKLFLYYLLSSLDFSVLVTGSGQPQIVRGPLAELQIRLPSERAEQNAIAAILSEMDAEIAGLESELSKARGIKQGMMQELLTGRIRLL
jgi:type I restriction enzyme S subunit